MKSKKTRKNGLLSGLKNGAGDGARHVIRRGALSDDRANPIEFINERETGLATSYDVAPCRMTGRTLTEFINERETGLEPATSTLARLHSTTELLPQRGSVSSDGVRKCQLSAP